MENRYTYLKFLSVLSIALLWLPYVIMVSMSIIGSIMNQTFLIDFYVPAELFVMILLGLGCLNFVAVKLTYRLKEVMITSLVSVVLMLNIIVVPLITGLASSSTSPTGWTFVSILIVLVLYLAFTLFAGILSIYLTRHLWQRSN